MATFIGWAGQLSSGISRIESRLQNEISGKERALPPPIFPPNLVRIRMKMLIVMILIAVGLFGLAFYQSYRDQQRWKRLTAGKNPFRKGDRAEIPPLTVDGLSFDSSRR